MKAGVITMHSVANYGSQLQAYATQEKLKQYYDDVVIIDFKRPDTYGVKLMNTFAKGNPVKAVAISPTMLKWKQVFGRFQKKYLNLTEKTYWKEEDFKDFEDVADVYFAGSDQVWNTGWNKGIIPPYYLSFVPNGKPRFSYASSFGKSEIDDAEVAEVREYLEKFLAISVREESGKRLIEERLGISGVERILDPTLAMDAEFWRKIEPENKIEGEYILVYNLNRSKEFDEYAEELSKRTGLKLYRFCTRYDQIFRNGKSLVIPEILDFVTMVDNAKYVLTDSFHATAFSINLGTEPICIYPEEYSSRLADFLKLVEAGQRRVIGYDDFDVINRSVDFEKTERILKSERIRVDDFLERTIELA